MDNADLIKYLTDPNIMGGIIFFIVVLSFFIAARVKSRYAHLCCTLFYLLIGFSSPGAGLSNHFK